MRLARNEKISWLITDWLGEQLNSITQPDIAVYTRKCIIFYSKYIIRRMHPKRLFFFCGASNSWDPSNFWKMQEKRPIKKICIKQNARSLILLCIPIKYAFILWNTNSGTKCLSRVHTKDFFLSHFLKPINNKHSKVMIKMSNSCQTKKWPPYTNLTPRFIVHVTTLCMQNNSLTLKNCLHLNFIIPCEYAKTRSI